ncbi:MarR family winged helix-turn-helix transcriptional regulator [Luteipulveratus mongoliensis]|uniref:MarR family transcriptional regulator n=1 Tax=Luteipulveratus mongoliensis TaxID=571913 RepID=A0A0K1JMU5_9MICO|nr:MarR family winged helix-turn-helix transcriptional regulator [Luteipulveratus mongoliensis]AKU18042.1 MarR family transcriptional regulator [Luteipulveratus mongoliensis]
MEDSVDQHVARWTRELPWLDPVNEAVLARISILSRRMTASRRTVLDEDGLRHGQFKLLLMLRRGGPPYEASPSQLADLLGLTRGALSARLGPLEDAGLIARSHGDGDRRRVRVRLTTAGSAAFEQHARSEERHDTDLLSALTADEKVALADLLRKLVIGVESEPQRS